MDEFLELFVHCCFLYPPGPPDFPLILYSLRYIVAAGDFQATFTGAQQRFGVAILAFLVAGLFGRKEPHEDTATAASGGQGIGNSDSACAAACASTTGGAGSADPTAHVGAATCGGADDDDHAAGLEKNYEYDWEAYHATFKDKPLEDAVTELFAEYAALYARIAGYTGARVAAPMTLTEAQALQTQAKAFVTDHVTPLLGPIFSTKMHKLLCHLLDAIKWHGNLRNCNTSSNEAGHKEDKKYYRRTNGAFDSFTQQMVRQAQGTRGVLEAHERASGGGATAPAPRPPTHALPPQTSVDPASGTGAADSAAPVASLVPEGAAKAKNASCLTRQPVSTLATVEAAPQARAGKSELPRTAWLIPGVTYAVIGLFGCAIDMHCCMCVKYLLVLVSRGQLTLELSSGRFSWAPRGASRFVG